VDTFVVRAEAEDGVESKAAFFFSKSNKSPPRPSLSLHESDPAPYPVVIRYLHSFTRTDLPGGGS
jgi:hypothetical protein